MDITVIGDSHARRGISQRRFDWLGELLLDLKPDVVVDMGDWTDMPSLSSYDGSRLTGDVRPKAKFHGRNYKEDINAGIEAREKVQEKFNRAGRKRPHRVSLGGNHDDDRIKRALDFVPELVGTISVDDHLRKEYGWEHVPFLEPFQCGGFTFQHYFESGLMGKAIGGEYPATSHLKKQFGSCVAGHSHLFDESHRKTANRGRVQAFVAGCYLDPLQVEDYAGNANWMWDRGILVMKDVQKGFCHGGFQWISVEAVQRAYGN